MSSKLTREMGPACVVEPSYETQGRPAVEETIQPEAHFAAVVHNTHEGPEVVGKTPGSQVSRYVR